MKRLLAVAALVAAIGFAHLSPAKAGTTVPGCVVTATAPDGSQTYQCDSNASVSVVTAEATPAPAAAVEPSRVGTVVTTAGKSKSPGYAVDLFRYHSINFSAVALDTNSRIPFTLGVSIMNAHGFSIGAVKLPIPSPKTGANRFGTYGVYLETRL